MIFYEDAHSVILFQSKDKPELMAKETSSKLLPSFTEVKAKYDKPVISQVLGVVIFLISSFGLYLSLAPTIASELSFRLSQFRKESVRIVKNEPVKPKRIQFSDLLGKVEFEQIPAPVDVNFGLVIPKIGVNVKVIPNVNAGKPNDFLKALKLGVAHAAGSSLPDQEGTVFIFGHSTDYAWNVARFNAVFYQIKDLEIGDEINVFYDARRYFYKVTEKRTVAATDTGFLSEPVIGRRLVLQTCWPPGTTKERLLVFAKPVEVEATSDVAQPVGL